MIGALLLGSAAVLIGAARSADEVDNVRPRDSRIAGNSWCGPVTRRGSDPVYAIYTELARYVDTGAVVISHGESPSIGSETFVLCGQVHGRKAD